MADEKSKSEWIKDSQELFTTLSVADRDEEEKSFRALSIPDQMQQVNTLGSRLNEFFRTQGGVDTLLETMHDALTKAGADITALNRPGENKSIAEMKNTIDALTKAAHKKYAEFLYTQLQLEHFGAFNEFSFYDRVLDESKGPNKGPECKAEAAMEMIKSELIAAGETITIATKDKKTGKTTTLIEVDLKVLEPKRAEIEYFGTNKEIKEEKTREGKAREDKVKKVFQSAFITEALMTVERFKTDGFGDSEIAGTKYFIKKARDVYPTNEADLSPLTSALNIKIDPQRTIDSQINEGLEATKVASEIENSRRLLDIIISGQTGWEKDPKNLENYMSVGAVKEHRAWLEKLVSDIATAKHTKTEDRYAILSRDESKTSQEMKELLEHACESTISRRLQDLFITLKTPGGVDNFKFDGRAIRLIKKLDGELSEAGKDRGVLDKTKSKDEIDAIITDALQSNVLRNGQRLVEQSRTGRWVHGTGHPQEDGWPQEASIINTPEWIGKELHKTLTEAGFEVKEGATIDDMAKIIAEPTKHLKEQTNLRDEQTKLRELAKKSQIVLPGTLYSPTDTPTNSPTIKDVVLPPGIILSPTNSPTTNDNVILPPGGPVPIKPRVR